MEYIYKYYPQMIIYKRNSMNWEEFYKEIVYCVEKLKDEYDFPSFTSYNYNPICFYKIVIKTLNNFQIWNYGLKFAIESNRPDLILHCLGKNSKLSSYTGLLYAIKDIKPEIVIYFLDNYRFNIDEINYCIKNITDTNQKQNILLILINYKLLNFLNV